MDSPNVLRQRRLVPPVAKHMRSRSRDDLRRLHFIHALFAHATGQDLYLAEQIKNAISFNLADFEAKIAAYPWAAKSAE